MLISIKGKQIDLGDSLRSHVQEKLKIIEEKAGYSCQEAKVHFSREGVSFRADISLHLDRHVLLQAHYASGDVYAAFDNSCDRLAKRVRRYKSKMRNGHRVHDHPTTLDAGAVGAGVGAGAVEEADGPLIIADMSVCIEKSNAHQAASKLLAADDCPAMLFRNLVNGKINMVYRRSDGNVVWVDPDLLDRLPSSNS